MDHNEHYVCVHVALSTRLGPHWCSSVSNLFTQNSLVRRDLEWHLVSFCFDLLDVETTIRRVKVVAVRTARLKRGCARKCATDIYITLFAMASENLNLRQNYVQYYKNGSHQVCRRFQLPLFVGQVCPEIRKDIANEFQDRGVFEFLNRLCTALAYSPHFLLTFKHFAK